MGNETDKAGAETVGVPGLDQALRAAIVEHSKSEQASGGAKAVEPKADDTKAKTDEQGARETEKAPVASDESAEEQLLSDEDFEKLKGDPAKLRKELQTAFTQKTQKLSEERKKLDQERAERSERETFLQQLEEDPIGVLEQVARESGYQLVKGKGEDKPAVSPAVEILKKHLGPELEGLAEQLAPALVEIAESVARKHIAPIEGANATREVQGELKGLGARHPDWAKYEKDIVSLSYKYLPGRNVSPAEYLDFLYEQATKGKKAAQETKKVIERVTRSVAASESADSGAATTSVTPEVPKKPSLEESYKMALRGQLVEE